MNYFNTIKLRKLVFSGASVRYGKLLQKHIVDRINYELDLIAKNKLVKLFLIFFEIVQFAKKNNILIEPGRGSASASLINYCLGITGIDPIAHRLVFEQYLWSPIPRPNIPDITIDADSDRIDEIKIYLLKKYGKKYAKTVLNDDLNDTKEWLRIEIGDNELIKNSARKKISDFISSNIVIEDRRESGDSAWHYTQALIDEYYNNSEIFNIFNNLDSFTNSAVKQPDGLTSDIVITKKPLKSVELIKYGRQIIEYITPDFLEELDMQEYYYIHLNRKKSLNIISRCIGLIKKNKDVNITPSAIPLSDNKTFHLLSKGDTEGIPELHIPRIRGWLIKLKPEKIHHLCAIYVMTKYEGYNRRLINEYVSHKHNKTERQMHSLVRPYLAETFGLMIYREQAILTLMDICQYSPIDAVKTFNDIIKRKTNSIDITKAIFLEKVRQKLINKKEALKLFKDISENQFIRLKSHYMPEITILYWMAYLKAHYLNEFKQVLSG